VKRLSTFAALVLAGTAPALAQALPSGIYAINGTVTKVSGAFCVLPLNASIGGAILYPGAQSDKNLIISLQGVTAGKAVRLVSLSAFPPVPAAGLNGWTPASPATPNYNQFLNGTNTGGDVSAIVSFGIKAIDTKIFPAAQGTIDMSEAANGPCKQQFLITLQYTGAY